MPDDGRDALRAHGPSGNKKRPGLPTRARLLARIPLAPDGKSLRSQGDGER